MPTKNKCKNDELRYYNVRKHEIVIIVLMVVVFVGIILVMPWLIVAIDLLFRQIPGWGDLGADTTATLNIGVLPDFLGGAIGIIAGFIMEWCFFDQLKLLGKYKTLIVLLGEEFQGILIDLYRQEEEKLEYYQEMKDIISGNIILSTENGSVIYNLHRFLKSKKGEIYRLILNIYRDVEHYNMLLNKKDSKDDEIERDIEDIKAGIKIFSNVTDFRSIKQIFDAREDNE